MQQNERPGGSTDIRQAVKSQYAAVARSGLSSRQAGVKAVAEAFGYSADELAAIPAEANMGLSCGNPIAHASLRLGEVVVDLGCGGGLDVLLAASKVGPSGRAIGIDMTEDMIALARQNAAKANRGQSAQNVDFYLATIDHLPLEDSSADCVISNCVINLAPDKPAVFREMVRILKPGGRVAISDIALKQPLPAELGEDLLAYIGCISGAILIDDYRRGLMEAGFAGAQVVDSEADLNVYGEAAGAACCVPSPDNGGLQIVDTGCCSPSSPLPPDSADLHRQLAELLQRYDINAYAASVRIFAVKPSPL